MSQTLSFLNADQRVKHFELLQLLKEREGQWLRIADIDDRELQRGARITHFPMEWLEGMQLWCAARHCPYHLRLDAEESEEVSVLDQDDRAHWAIKNSSLCYEPHRPQTEEEAMELLGYPADDTSEEVGLPIQPYLDRKDLATIAMLQSLAVKGLAWVVDTKAPAQSSAVDMDGEGSGTTVGGGGSGERSLFHRGKGSAAPIEALPLRRENFTSFWESLPITMHCSHHTSLGVTMESTDGIPAVVRPEERLQLTFRDRAMIDDQGENHFSTTTTSVQWKLSMQFLSSDSSAGGGGSTATADAVVVGGNARQGWLTSSTAASRAVTLKMSPWQQVHGRPSVLRFDVEWGGAKREASFSWHLTVAKDPPPLAGKGGSSMVLYQKEFECPAAIHEDSLPQSIQLNNIAIDGSDNVTKEEEDVTMREGDSSIGRRQIEKWWSQTSPVAVAAAAISAPDDASLKAAAGAIFAPSVHAVMFGGTKSHSKELMELQAVRRKRRRYQDLRNTHMIHFGLDLSKPFVAHQPSPLQ